MISLPTTAHPSSPDDDLSQEVAALRQLVQRQQSRLDALELAASSKRLPVPAPVEAPTPDNTVALTEDCTDRVDVADHVGDVGVGGGTGRVGRRQILRRVGGLTAGATVGGLALALADQTPAAAATLNGSGDPGINANGIGGHGVDATTDTSEKAALHGSTTTNGAFGLFARRDFGSGYAAGITNQVGGGRALIVTGFQNESVVEVQNNGASTDNLTDGLLVTNTHGCAASFNGRVQIYLNPAGLSPRDGRTGTFFAGSIVADVNRDLWFNTGDGSPATWRKVSGPATAGQFHVLAATNRVYDSRPGNLPNIGSKTKIDGTADRVISTTKGNVGGVLTGAVPDGASAALVNLTIVNTSASGFLGLYKNGIEWPGNSSINWTAAGTVLANSAIVALDELVQFKVKCSSGSSSDFIVDVIGYYL